MHAVREKGRHLRKGTCGKCSTLMDYVGECKWINISRRAVVPGVPVILRGEPMKDRFLSTLSNERKFPKVSVNGIVSSVRCAAFTRM